MFSVLREVNKLRVNYIFKTVGNSIEGVTKAFYYNLRERLSKNLRSSALEHLLSVSHNYLSTIDIIQHKKEFVPGLEAEVQAHKKGVI